jgi:hypothetical protein
MYRVLRDNIKDVDFYDAAFKIFSVYIRSNLNTTMLKSSQIWKTLLVNGRHHVPKILDVSCPNCKNVVEVVRVVELHTTS